jgi:hypothetical protein
MKRLILILLVGAWTPRLEAQGTVVLPDAPLDSARATLRDDLLTFRDSLKTIDAAAARLHRDFRQASEAVLRSRARVMTDACIRATRNLPLARGAVQASKASNEVRRQTRKDLLAALDRLDKVLSRCRAEFENLSRPGQGEEVRGYGNNRAMRIQSGLRDYDRVVARYLAAMGIKAGPTASPAKAVSGLRKHVDSHVHIMLMEPVFGVYQVS